MLRLLFSIVINVIIVFKVTSLSDWSLRVFSNYHCHCHCLFWSCHVSSSVWSNGSKATGLWDSFLGCSLNVFHNPHCLYHCHRHCHCCCHCLFVVSKVTGLLGRFCTKKVNCQFKRLFARSPQFSFAEFVEILRAQRACCAHHFASMMKYDFVIC